MLKRAILSNMWSNSKIGEVGEDWMLAQDVVPYETCKAYVI